MTDDNQNNDDAKNGNNDNIPNVGIYLSPEQFEALIGECKGLTRDELSEILAAKQNLSDAEINAIKKAVHEETRASKAEFMTKKKAAVKKWGLPASALYWAKEQVPDYKLSSFLVRNVAITTGASLAVAITANIFMDKLNHTEMGEIKASSAKTTINSGTYSPEIGQGPYIFIGNALSNGMKEEGAIGYGYNGPGGAQYNYFALAKDGNELQLSLVEPVVAENFENRSPNKSRPDDKMSNYATLIKKIDIEECAWSASGVYTDYSDIIKELEAGKSINLAWQWNGTGSDYARTAIYNAFLSDYAPQIKLVQVQDNVDMLNKLESGAIDLAVFTEAAGTFEGSVTGTLRKTLEMHNVELVNLDPAALAKEKDAKNPEETNTAQAGLKYTFRTLSVPTTLSQWSSAPEASKPLGTMCNEYIGLYGRNPASINDVSTAMAAQRTHNIAKDVNVAQATGYKAFPVVKSL